MLRRSFASRGRFVTLLEPRWAPSFVYRYFSIGASCCRLRTFLLCLTLKSDIGAKTSSQCSDDERGTLTFGWPLCQMPATDSITWLLDAFCGECVKSSSRPVNHRAHAHLCRFCVRLDRLSTRVASLTRCRPVGDNMASHLLGCSAVHSERHSVSQPPADFKTFDA
jgi:hypothetical protein